MAIDPIIIDPDGIEIRLMLHKDGRCDIHQPGRGLDSLTLARILTELATRILQNEIERRELSQAELRRFQATQYD